MGYKYFMVKILRCQVYHSNEVCQEKNWKKYEGRKVFWLKKDYFVNNTTIWYKSDIDKTSFLSLTANTYPDIYPDTKAMFGFLYG